MKQETKKLYLYLARRDKKGMEVLTVLNGPAVPPTRIKDVTSLGLPRQLMSQLKQSIYDDRMYWEPWIEAADTYADLVQSLRKRGYTNISVTPSVRHMSDISGLQHNIKTANVTKHSDRVISQRIPKRRTMLR